MLKANDEFLFTRQRHEAERMGLHYDYRLVHGDKAYSFATKKEMPEPGKMILLFEQPVHDRHYALSEKVVIPTGQYGAGVTYLDMIRKARLSEDSTEDKMVIHTSDGGKFLLKRMPKDSQYGDKSWLFRNVTPQKEPLVGTFIRQQEKAASVPEEIIRERFKPDLTPEQMKRLGVLAKQYFNKDPKDANFFKTDASMKEWPKEWIDKKTAPDGWFEWYEKYSAGERGPDDTRQMARWYSFKQRHLAQLQKADPELTNLSVQPRRRQALLNWGIAPGLNVNKYLEKVAEMRQDLTGQPPKKKRGIAAKFGTAVATQLGLGVLSAPTSLLALKSMKAPDTTGVTEDHVKSYVKAKGLRHVERNSAPDIAAHYKPSFMGDKVGKKTPKPYVQFTSPSVGLHEYGHANSFNSSRKKSYHKIRMAGKLGGLMAAQSHMPTALIGALGAQSDNKKVQAASVALTAASQLPTLLEEGKATMSPYMHLRRTAGKGIANKFLKKMAPAYGTYVANAAVNSLTPLVAKKYHDYRTAKMNK